MKHVIGALALVWFCIAFDTVGNCQSSVSVTPPALGGCTATAKFGQVCWGADALVNLLQINLAESTIGLSVGGGPGVIVRAWSGTNYSAGLGFYLTTNIGNQLPNEVDPSVVANFLTYARVGIKWIIREQENSQPFLKQACLLVGVGVN